MAEYRIYFPVTTTYCLIVERDEEDLTKEQVLETIKDEDLMDAYGEELDFVDVLDAYKRADVEVEEEVNFI